MEAILKIISFYYAVKYLPANAMTLFSSNILALLLVFILLIYSSKSLRIFRGEAIAEIKIREVFTFSYPISIGAIFNWIQLQGYRMVLVPLGLTEAVGIYATVSNIGIAGMNAYSTIFTQLFMPNVYKTHGVYIKKYLRNVFASIIVVFIVTFICSDLIVKTLTKEAFVKYSNLILYGVVTEAGNFIIGAIGVYLSIINRTILGLKVSVVAITSMLLIFCFIYISGYMNVYTIGIPIIVSQIVTSVILLCICYKKLWN